MSLSLSPAVMWRAFVERDARFAGQFVMGVRTTRIFCQAGCPARIPLRENVTFYANPTEALRAGYRPCKRCRPMAAPGSAPAWLQTLLDAVEHDTTRRWRDRDVAQLGLEPKRVRRWFQKEHNMTFHAYQRARRLGVALGALQTGAPVGEVALDVGYESESGFREAFGKLFPTLPSRAAQQTVIELARLTTPLGPMLAGVRVGSESATPIASAQTRASANPTERGTADASDSQPCAALRTPRSEDALVLLEFNDRRSLETQLTTLKQRFAATLIPRATDRPLWKELQAQLARYFAGEAFDFALPLDAPGTAFQTQVWAELCKIPFGATRSYGELAETLGRPGASRALGTANGSNRIAIVIPCHRVIHKDGGLSGYAGGVSRKRALLDLESGQKPTNAALFPE